MAETRPPQLASRTHRGHDPVAADLAMLIAARTGERPLSEVLAEHGRSPSTYYDKLRRFRRHGVAGLVPAKPGPRRPWRVTEEVARLIVTARTADRSRPAARIAKELASRGYAVSVRSVERTLTRFGLTTARTVSRRKSEVGRAQGP